jgi:hypothetical protein
MLNVTDPPGVAEFVPVPTVALKLTGTPTAIAPPLAGDVSTSVNVDDVICAPVPSSATVGVPETALLLNVRSSSAFNSGTGGVKLAAITHEVPAAIVPAVPQPSDVTEKPAVVDPLTVYEGD